MAKNLRPKSPATLIAYDPDTTTERKRELLRKLLAEHPNDRVLRDQVQGYMESLAMLDSAKDSLPIGEMQIVGDGSASSRRGQGCPHSAPCACV